MNEATQEELATLSDPTWRDGWQRAAHAALLRADSGLPILQQVFARLMQDVHRADNLTALRSLRRIVRVMEEFSSITFKERELLSGSLYSNLIVHGMTAETSKMTSAELVEFFIQKRREVWNSRPEMALLRADLDAEAELTAAAVRQQAADLEAERLAREQRIVEAPAVVLRLHQAGIRLDIGTDGRTCCFPASALNDELHQLLAQYSAEMPAAIRALQLSV